VPGDWLRPEAYAKLKSYPRKEGRFQEWYYEFYDTPQNFAETKEGPNQEKKSNGPILSQESYLTPWLEVRRRKAI
jgi:hypothetical protein